MNSIDFKKAGINLKQSYTIEYIDNKHDMDKVNSGKHPAPWELYKVKHFDDLQDAIDLFVHYYAWDNILDVKLFESIQLNGETIQERCITNIYNFGAIVDSESQSMRRRYNDLQDTIKEYQKELDCMNSFIGKYKAENT